MSRAFFIQLKRELGALLLSPIAHVIFVVISVFTTLNFMMCVSYMAQGVKEITIMQIFFQFFLFWIILLPLIPILTMRLFSEEYKTGTIEMLLTAPIKDWDIVLAKFFGTVIFFMLLWLPPLIYLMIFQIVSKNQVPLNWAPLGLSYLLIFMVGSFWTSIGLFCSSLTKNQIVAAILGLGGTVIVFFASMIASFAENQEVARYLATYLHMVQFSQGVFDTRPVVYYVSGTLLFLFLTRQVLSVQRLKS